MCRVRTRNTHSVQTNFFKLHKVTEDQDSHSYGLTNGYQDLSFSDNPCLLHGREHNTRRTHNHVSESFGKSPGCSPLSVYFISMPAVIQLNLWPRLLKSWQIRLQNCPDMRSTLNNCCLITEPNTYEVIILFHLRLSNAQSTLDIREDYCTVELANNESYVTLAPLCKPLKSSRGLHSSGVVPNS